MAVGLRGLMITTARFYDQIIDIMFENNKYDKILFIRIYFPTNNILIGKIWSSPPHFLLFFFGLFYFQLNSVHFDFISNRLFQKC